MFYRAFSVFQKVNFSSENGVPVFQGDLVRYLFCAITARRVHRLGSFFDMMRISSSYTNCTKGVYFCSAVFEKLASKLPSILAPEAVDSSGFDTVDTSGFDTVDTLTITWALLTGCFSP